MNVGEVRDATNTGECENPTERAKNLSQTEGKFSLVGVMVSLLFFFSLSRSGHFL